MDGGEKASLALRGRTVHRPNLPPEVRCHRDRARTFSVGGPQAGRLNTRVAGQDGAPSRRQAAALDWGVLDVPVAPYENSMGPHVSDVAVEPGVASTCSIVRGIRGATVLQGRGVGVQQV